MTGKTPNPPFAKRGVGVGGGGGPVFPLNDPALPAGPDVADRKQGAPEFHSGNDVRRCPR